MAAKGLTISADWMPDDEVITPSFISNKAALAKFAEFETMLPYRHKIETSV